FRLRAPPPDEWREHLKFLGRWRPCEREFLLSCVRLRGGRRRCYRSGHARTQKQEILQHDDFPQRGLRQLLGGLDDECVGKSRRPDRPISWRITARRHHIQRQPKLTSVPGCAVRRWAYYKPLSRLMRCSRRLLAQ